MATNGPIDIESLPLPPPLDLLPNDTAAPLTMVDPLCLLPELPPVDISGDGSVQLDDIMASLPPPPPPLPIDDYEQEYGPTTSTEPELEPIGLADGEIPRFDEVNEQYEFLRRTLSHSHRRYSARFKRPRPKSRPPVEGEGQSSLDRPGQLRGGEPAGGGEGGTSLDAPGMIRSPVHPIKRQTHGNVQSARRPRPPRSTQRTGHHSAYHSRTSATSSGETHVDSSGRTYFLDHSTHTINYGTPSSQPSSRAEGGVGFDARREMLNRRYQSLQRSFRSAHHRRRDPTQEEFLTNLTPIESVGAISYQPLATPTSEGSGTTPRKKKGRQKSSKGWFTFTRNKSRTVSQTETPSDVPSDDLIPVTPSSDIYSPLSPPPTLEDLGVSIDVLQSTSTSGESSPHPVGSLDENRFTGSLDENRFASSELEAELSIGPEALIAIVDQNQPLPLSDASERQRASAAPTDLDIAAAAVVQQRMRSNRRISRETSHHEGGGGGDTDDETNEEMSPRASVSSPPVPQSTNRSSDIEQSATAATTSSDAQVEPVSDTTSKSKEKKKAGVKVASPVKFTEALKESPALKFITRPDLYSFLSSAGEAGEVFFSQRALMELVQRIRADNSLFAKYQHSRLLVQSLNKFAQIDRELPSDWERKLNKQGRVFFIDHKHQLTSFIDPRLPTSSEDTTKKISTSSIPATVRRVYSTSNEPELRPHHSTVMLSHSVSSPTTVEQGDGDRPPVTENSYEEQVVAFFNLPNVEEKIAQRYRRNLRPQMREAIEDIKRNGVSALERVQLSGGGTALELTLILSMFEEEISAIRPHPRTPQITVENTSDQSSKGGGAVGTIQRQKQAFAAKLQTFKLQLARLGFAQGSRLKFNIRRDHLLEDAYEHVMKSEIRHLQRKRLNISFIGEEGLDYGGPSREFFFLLSRNIFNPYFGLFEYSANDTYTIQISPTSLFIQNNLDWFRFAGRIVGLVIAQGFLLDVFFTRPTYKSILGKPPLLRDLESLEPAFYNSLVWIQENDPEPLDLTFTIEEEAFDQLTMHELKEGGADIPVLNENKQEYIDLMIRWRLDRGVAEQTHAFLKGYSEIMPRSLIQQFDSHELEFLIAGTLEIDVDDWKSNTDYRNGYHDDHPVILWFWQAVEMFDNEQRLRLLQFVTGTSSVPYEGFKALRGSSGPKRFTVDYFNDVRSLPRAHTCFNRVDLPPYPTFEILFEKLRTAIEEGGTFGIE